MEIRFVLCEVEGCEKHAEEWVGRPALRSDLPECNETGCEKSDIDENCKTCETYDTLPKGPLGLCHYHVLEFKIHRLLERYIGPMPIEVVSHIIIGLMMKQISLYEDKAKGKGQTWNMVDCTHWPEKVKGECPYEENEKDCGNCQDYVPVFPPLPPPQEVEE